MIYQQNNSLVDANKILMEAKRKQIQDNQQTEKQLEKAILSYFPYNGQEGVERRREQLKQERIADQKALLEEIRDRHAKSAEKEEAQL